MKTKLIPGFVLFISTAVLLSGCNKSNSNLASENAALKARIQKLEQQLQESSSQPAPTGAQPAANPGLQSQLEEAQKKAEAAGNELTSLRTQVQTQKEQIDTLTQQLSGCQQAGEKNRKDLELYRDQAASAIKEFQTLRSALGDGTVQMGDYHQSYLATQAAVVKLMELLPQSKVRRAILSVWNEFTRIDQTWQTSTLQMQERTRQAQAYYDQFVHADGLGPTPYLEEMGKTRLLAPAEKENAATMADRDQQILSLEPALDRGLKSLQALLNG